MYTKAKQASRKTALVIPHPDLSDSATGKSQKRPISVQPFSMALLRRIWSRSQQFPVCCLPLPLWPAISRRCAPRKWIPWLRFANNNILLSVVMELRPR